jgi:hypothetical protein
MKKHIAERTKNYFSNFPGISFPRWKKLFRKEKV